MVGDPVYEFRRKPRCRGISVVVARRFAKSLFTLTLNIFCGGWRGRTKVRRYLRNNNMMAAQWALWFSGKAALKR